MNKYVLGDIHGGARGLSQVLERADFDFKNDQLICLGDVYDGWSESAQAVDILMKVKNLVLIIGNHDNWVLRLLPYTQKEKLSRSDMDELSMWLTQGGEATLKSYDGKSWDYVEKHMNWFIENYQAYYIDQNSNVFLHAGFDALSNFHNQPITPYSSEPAPRGENPLYFWDRSLWQQSSYLRMQELDPEKPDPTQEDWARAQGTEFRNIYVGHNPTILNSYSELSSELPVQIHKICNMDTGASYHGKLSLMNIESKELFQSDYLHTLYPGEKGRNRKILTEK